MANLDTSADTSIGIVIPTFRPDTRQLTSYVRAIVDSLRPETIRVELDAPISSESITPISETGATVSISSSRRGKGSAITAGFEALDTDLMLFLDGDGSTPVTSAAAILRPLQDGSADVGVGSRRHPAATVTSHQTRLRRRLGDTFATVARATLPVSLYDYQCGAKAITANAWAQVRTHLYEEGFAWDLELVSIAEALGLSIAEIPITWEDKPGSTVDPVSTTAGMIRALLSVRHRAQALDGHLIHSRLPASRSETLVRDD
ncbi:glycosyltransferase [Saliphagus sp. LR7]|uniref:glycosyltransferase n=1 Tax=Saliphagus sp. LR7 TaxID=2282654 RepID=UPI000DF79799